MNAIGNFLVGTPVFAIFICLALGYLLGKLKIGSFKLGATVGVLIVALLIGQLGVFTRDTLLGDIFFDFFMFAIGYRVGPTFISSMKKFGAKIVYATLIFLVSAFIVAYACFKMFHIGPGIAAGIIAGGLTQSAVIGSSLETISKLQISDHLKTLYSNQIPIVYALTYVFGTIGVLIFLRDIMPKLMHIDLKKQAVKTAKELDMIPVPVIVASTHFYTINDGSSLIGQTLGTVNTKFAKGLVAAGLNDSADMASVINAGDILAISGGIDEIGRAVQEFNLLEVTGKTKAYVSKQVVLKKNFSADVLKNAQDKGVLVATLAGDVMDPAQFSTLKPAESVTLVGQKDAVSEVQSQLGRLRAAENIINYSWFALGIALSAALGIVGTKVSGVPIALGGGTASLIVGLVQSIYRDKHAHMDTIPDSLLEFFQSIGLNLFIATVGLSAAKTFISAIQSMGISVLLIGAVISILPHIITFVICYYLMKMEPISIIGAQTGADTLSAALNDISERVGSDASPFFAAAVAPAYAIGNIFLTLMGPIFIVLLSK
ncbi:aspartate-alanine antiporter [Latilactobacillus curvatus]|uniref:Aspartate-alanine antiporter n=1 Tax=Latilactobacillus curvatus TaxID=28038 RepID=A0ABN6GHS0_LATCU|nr:aspartate-alanine antiporter [Latilactobacillus curvatus]BCX30380.1 aspartate-alanine antiporter [Latilactobacillus curvatus]